jgi:hypothetical protein
MDPIHIDPTPATNIIILNGPNEELSSTIQESPLDPQKPVLSAASKFFTEEEIQQVKHGYRRSKMNLEALISDIMSLDIPEFEIEKNENYYRAISYVESRMLPADRKFRPIHLEDLPLYPWKLGVSSCEPYRSDPNLRAQAKDLYKQGLLKNTNLNYSNLKNYIFHDIIAKNELIMNAKTDGLEYNYDINAFARAHLVTSNDPDKIRFVFGCPKQLVISEASFLWPITSWMKESKDHHMMAWSYETLKGGLYKIENELREHRRYTVFSIDWSKFDKRAHFDIIKDIHAVWRRHLDFSHGYAPTFDYPNGRQSDDPEIEAKLDRLWSWTSQAVMHCPIRAPDGSRYQRKFCGIPSGVFQTNLLDSWVNAIIISSLLLESGIDLNSLLFFRVMGDDSLVVIPQPKSVLESRNVIDQFPILAERMFNFIMNIDKSSFTETFHNVKFLGFKNNSTLPYKASTELIASLAYPERITDWRILAARAIGIAWASCYHDPRVYHICKDVFEFITEKMKLKPRFTQVEYLEILGVPEELSTSTSFPTPGEIMRTLLNAKHDAPHKGIIPLDFFIEY